MKRNSFRFLRIYFELLEGFEPEDFLKCIELLIRYALDDVVPDNMDSLQKLYFHIVKPLVDAEREKEDRICQEYRNFRDIVLSRDMGICQRCGKKGKGMNVHHIKSFKEYPTLRFDPDNGITLCNKCHKEVHRGEK